VDVDKLPPPPPDAGIIRSDSLAAIKKLGGKSPDYLPYFEQTEPRTGQEAIERTLVMLGMLHIHFRAPIPVIAKWVSDNRLETALSAREKAILTETQTLTEQQNIDLYWYIEALWTLAWAGSLVRDLPLEEPVGDALMYLLPDIRKNEGRDLLENKFRLRASREIYSQLDLYYLAHWYARDGRLRGYPTSPFNLDVIMERRKTLQWLNDRSYPDWDGVSLDT
jgi:hypothetical protein